MEIIKLDKTQGALVYKLFDKYRVFYKQPSNIEVSTNFIKEGMNNNESIIFVALIGSIPIGFTQLYPKFSSTRVTRNWILNDLYVDVEYRKLGIGEELIRTAMNFAKANGASFVELSTEVDNITAQRLYERVGFNKQGECSSLYRYRIYVLDYKSPCIIN
tara:strand:+ start:101 stop:580 length:480 start_codon:yes stop_codon:yes gene_type:complete